METAESPKTGFGWPWLALTAAFALHVVDEAATGFLDIYNPTVTAMRARWGWFPMPPFQFREWLVGLLVAVAICFALTPLAARNAPWLRPLAWFYALIMLFNSFGHALVTILGHTIGIHPGRASRAGILFVTVAVRWIGVDDQAVVAHRPDKSAEFAASHVAPDP